MSGEAVLGEGLLGELVLGQGLAAPERHTSVQEALRQFIIDAIARTIAAGLVRATKVYSLRRPQSANDLPCILIDKTAEDRLEGLNCTSDNATYTFALKIVSTLPGEPTELAHVILAALGKRAADDFPFFALGREFSSAWLDNADDETELNDDDSDDALYVAQQNFSLIVED